MNNSFDSTQITPNIYLTRNESEIIDCLVDHQEMPKDFDENKVVSFFNGKDFHLVLYFPQANDRGFQMYVVRDFSIHVEDLFVLRALFSQLIQQGYSVNILKKAHYRVDHLIHMARTFRAMLHKEEIISEDDY
ncbi:hypothetical protein GCM10027275_07690 [Rhabdobacter roseus]|uniref:DUF1828 domain-containing protein n=1 Tax=Rhabdobacter roseus TaxID=1655419 RepID=A0A840TRR5_9BACT|nr:hypothetical protein [Rhabdobacter roseus]MBB5282668.1 hypothetical protein [Rhabdobacter roseus]